MPDHNLIRTQERYYTAHHTLIRIARNCVQRAERGEPGWADDHFIAVSFCAFSIEAIANAVGEVVFDEWSTYESHRPLKKIMVLCDTLGVYFDKTVDPWSTLVWLCRFRNDVAHPKPEWVRTRRPITRQEYEREIMPDPPQSKLEKHCTSGNARRAVNAIDNLLQILSKQLSDEQRFGITGDMWMGSTELRDP